MSDLFKGKYNSLIEGIVQKQRGSNWKINKIIKCEEPAMHETAFVKGNTSSVFVKMGNNVFSDDQFHQEVWGLNYIRENSSDHP